MSSKLRASGEGVTETFTERLNAELSASGLSDAALAKRMEECGGKVSPGAVLGWRGGANPKQNRLVPLAKALGVRLEWLLAGIGPRSELSSQPRPELRPEDDIQFATNEPPAMYASRPLDRAVLRRILMAIDREQVEKKKYFSPERRAEAIAVVYEMLSERTVDDEAFQHFIRALLAT